MTNSWVAKPVRLKFLLGEVTLFSVTFSSLVLEEHFTRLTGDPTGPRLPVEGFSSGLEAMVIRSHPVESDLPRLALLPESIRYVPAQYRRYYIDLQGSFSDYLKKFSAKSRSTLVRKVRKFAEFSGGEIAWREFRCREEITTFHRLAREVSEKTYQERLLDAGLPAGEGFRQQLSELAARGLARGYVLFLGERPIAYLFCPAEGEVLLYQHLGYDPEFRRHSPGTVLQYLALESLFAEGRFRMFDFTEGEGPHKEFFATGSVRCADLYYFPPTSRNLLLLGLHSGLNAFSETAVKGLDAIGLKARVKKLLRSKA